jgi:hypothetical protein
MRLFDNGLVEIQALAHEDGAAEGRPDSAYRDLRDARTTTRRELVARAA